MSKQRIGNPLHFESPSACVPGHQQLTGKSFSQTRDSSSTAIAMDISGYSSRTQVAAGVVMDPKDLATRTEACLLDAEMADNSTQQHLPAEDGSGLLLDPTATCRASARTLQTPLQQLQMQQQMHRQNLKQQQQQEREESGLIPISGALEPPISGEFGGGCGDGLGGNAWMDAGSVWSSVQRHGEELQRRQRQPPPPPRRRLSVVGAAAAAVGSWRRGPLRRFFQRLRTQVIVTSRVAAKDPYTVVAPVVLLVAMLALGLWGVFSVSNAIRDGRRQAAHNAATDFSNTLKSHIAATVAPASTLKTLIEEEPTWPLVNQTFYKVAPKLVEKGRETDAILTIVLCPQGIASAIAPPGLPAWDQVFGLDLLQNRSWRNDALKAVALHEQGMVMTGPSRLRAGMMGIVTRYAVFIAGAGPEETFGFNGSAYNCSPCYVPPAGPTTPSKRFWGFAQLNVDWEVLIRNVTRMYDLCDRDGLPFNMTYIDPVTFVNRSIASCGAVGSDPVVVHVYVMANHWVLAVGDARGWTPDWLPLVVAVVVVVSVWVAVAMAIILINRREHMWLLEAMLPKKVIAALRRGEEYAEAFECVTILFSDIVSYTTLASEMEPIKVVRLLNEMYSEFDALVDQFECYKVETIGDAFMAVCGTQGEDAVAAAVKVARLAQAMIERTKVLESADGQKIQIRLGLHSGPVVGAVVGFKMPHFCLCGDTVNTASRMESNSRPMRIHISNSTAELLRRAMDSSGPSAACSEGGVFFRLQRRGMIQVKGKGLMLTHWLLPAEVGGEEEKDAAATSALAAPMPPVDAAAEAEASPTVRLDVSSLQRPQSSGGLVGGGGLSGPVPGSSQVVSSSAARQRLSDIGAVSAASFCVGGSGSGGIGARSLQQPNLYSTATSSAGGGSGGGEAVTMTCTGGGTGGGSRKSRAPVDLRLFQSGARRSKAGSGR